MQLHLLTAATAALAFTQGISAAPTPQPSNQLVSPPLSFKKKKKKKKKHNRKILYSTKSNRPAIYKGLFIFNRSKNKSFRRFTSPIYFYLSYLSVLPSNHVSAPQQQPSLQPRSNEALTAPSNPSLQSLEKRGDGVPSWLDALYGLVREIIKSSSDDDKYRTYHSSSASYGYPRHHDPRFGHQPYYNDRYRSRSYPGYPSRDGDREFEDGTRGSRGRYPSSYPRGGDQPFEDGYAS